VTVVDVVFVAVQAASSAVPAPRNDSLIVRRMPSSAMRILSGTRLIQLVSSPDAASFAFVEKESVTCAMPESNVTTFVSSGRGVFSVPASVPNPTPCCGARISGILTFVPSKCSASPSRSSSERSTVDHRRFSTSGPRCSRSRLPKSCNGFVGHSFVPSS
jgi:hypothetical protein